MLCHAMEIARKKIIIKKGGLHCLVATPLRSISAFLHVRVVLKCFACALSFSAPTHAFNYKYMAWRYQQVPARKLPVGTKLSFFAAILSTGSSLVNLRIKG